MARPVLVGVAALIAVSALCAASRPASACGGCFIPQETPSVVTDHRMILSVRRGESTLYDQIRYQGSPESFAWVLPISGEATVGLSADGLFGVLDQLTQVTVLQALRSACPGPPCAIPTGATTATTTSGPNDINSVTVTKNEVVGPYETVQLQATNPEALSEWLAANRFSVPEDVKPVIAQYVREKFNFLAMKLVPGASVQAMRPVRVTTKGASVTLPLRMVAAGTGAVVGIGLWVIAEGRYEPQNFPSFVIPQEELVWDWSSSRSNYAELRSRKGALANGRGWEVESSLDLPAPSLEARLKSQLGRTGAGDYAAIPGGDAGVGKTASEVRDEDLGVLLDPSLASVRVTRMRADLVHSALTEDLVLAATSDQAILGTTRRPTRSIHEPPCPEYTCPPESSRDGTTLEGGSCAAGPGDASSGLVLASVVALGFVARARRKRTG